MTVLSADGTLQCGDERRSGVLLDPAHPLERHRLRRIPPRAGRPLHPRCDLPESRASSQHRQFPCQRRHPHRRSQGRESRDGRLRSSDAARTGRSRGRLLALCAGDRPSHDGPRTQSGGFQLQGGVPERVRLPRFARLPAAHPRGAGARLSRQGLPELPPADGRSDRRAQSRLDGAAARPISA